MSQSGQVENASIPSTSQISAGDPKSFSQLRQISDTLKVRRLLEPIVCIAYVLPFPCREIQKWSFRKVT